MVHIVCVKWGKLYGSGYVNHLYKAVERNTTLDFDFTCFTDNADGVIEEIACRSLPVKALQGWWQKMYLFSNDILIKDRILYFDLDTVIVRNIDPLMKFDGKFAILRDLYRAKKNTKAREFGSGIMAWQGGEPWTHKVWADFYANWEKNSKMGSGDQAYLMKVIPFEHVTYWQDHTDGIISYKAHVRDEAPKDVLPENARVICFHGNPRPHEVAKLGWMQEHWSHYA